MGDTMSEPVLKRNDKETDRMDDSVYKPVLCNKISLRKLRIEDAKPMLEWMQTPEIYEKMQYDPHEQNIERCIKFIKNSWRDQTSVHYAVANHRGEYLGTVSLKNIDKERNNAEFGIALHPKAMGSGIGGLALHAIMKKAFEELNLNKVYLYVRCDNEKAVAFYKKHHLEYEGCFKEHLYVRGEYKDIYWFALRRRGYEEWKITEK